MIIYISALKNISKKKIKKDEIIVMQKSYFLILKITNSVYIVITLFREYSYSYIYALFRVNIELEKMVSI